MGKVTAPRGTPQARGLVPLVASRSPALLPSESLLSLRSDRLAGIHILLLQAIFFPVLSLWWNESWWVPWGRRHPSVGWMQAGLWGGAGCSCCFNIPAKIKLL